MRINLCAYVFLLAMAKLPAATWTDLHGTQHDPFASASQVHVFLFLRTDCPLANRYAPELQHIAQQYSEQPVDFWLVYPDRDTQPAAIQEQISSYGLRGTPLLDPKQILVQLAGATISPEAAVFNRTRHLTYLGRIDDRVTGFGSSRPAPTTHDLQQAIAQTLAGKPVAPAHTRAFGCYLADVK